MIENKTCSNCKWDFKRIPLAKRPRQKICKTCVDMPGNISWEEMTDEQKLNHQGYNPKISTKKSKKSCEILTGQI